MGLFSDINKKHKKKAAELGIQIFKTGRRCAELFKKDDVSLTENQKLWYSACASLAPLAIVITCEHAKSGFQKFGSDSKVLIKHIEDILFKFSEINNDKMAPMREWLPIRSEREALSKVYSVNSDTIISLDMAFRSVFSQRLLRYQKDLRTDAVNDRQLEILATRMSADLEGIDTPEKLDLDFASKQGLQDYFMIALLLGEFTEIYSESI